MYIEQTNLIAARKYAMDFHRRNGIKDLSEIRAHKKTWAELCNLETEIKREARSLLDKCDGKPDDVASVEPALDAFTALLDAVTTEKDIRTEIGSKGARATGDNPMITSKRPGYDTADTAEENRETAYAMAPEERFTTWAQARSSGEDLRGLSVGQYLRSMIVGGKTDVERRALSEGSDSSGGYTVPDVLSSTLIDLARANSVAIRAGAQSIPLTSDSNSIAKLASDPTPAWRAEAGTVATSDPTFDRIQLTPRSLAVQTLVSAELMEDSLNLVTELPRILAAAMALELDRVALLGSGTAPEPRGVANTVGIGTYAQNAPSTSYGNLSRARTGILTANCGPVSAFIMHPRDEGEFTEMSDGQGQPLQMHPNITNVPWLTTTAIPVNGGTGTDESTIFAGNFSRLLIGIRSDIRVEVLKTSAYASNLQYTLLAHMRADVAVTHPGAFYTLTGVGRAA